LPFGLPRDPTGLIAVIRSERPELPIILATGYSELQTRSTPLSQNWQSPSFRQTFQGLLPWRRSLKGKSLRSSPSDIRSLTIWLLYQIALGCMNP
jgi:hypothetical protein